MALRLYLTNSAAPFTPPTIRGSFSDKALNGVSYLARRKDGAGTTAAKAETSNSNTWSVLLRRFVSEPVNNPGTIQGAFTLMFGALETNIAANMNMQLHMFVTVGSTDVVRGALTALAYGGGVEFPAPSPITFACGVKVTGTMTTVAVQPGDRIVLELGYRAANTVTTSYTGTLYYGGTASDLGEDDRNVTTRPGWIDFAHIAVHDAFDIPFRSGTTTATVGVQSIVWDPSKVKSVSTTTTPAPSVAPLQGYKVMKTTTGPVRPPGRPPVGVPETGSITTGASERDGGERLTVPKLDYRQSTAERIPSTTAESVHTTHPTIIPYALIQGDHDISPPDIDLLTAPPPPIPPPPLRFIVQDIRTHRYLTWELPLIDVSITWTLSGPTMLTASLHPESPTLRELGITAWGSWIHVEQGGQLLASLIWQPTKIDGEDYTVTAMGFSGYAQGMPYFSEDRFILRDACDVMRRIWNHLQSPPDARLGVTLNGTMSGLKLGIPAMQELTDEGFLVWVEPGTEEKAPTRELGEDEDVVITGYQYDVSFNPPDLMVTYNDGAIYRFKPKMIEAVPYVLSWYSDTDCGQEFDNLARTAKVEYRETVRWATEGDIAIIPKTERRIELSYPRVGRKRFDLRCAQDENMLAAIPLEESTGAQGYASQVMTRGVGEGREAVRGYAGVADPKRVRRVAIVSDSTITTTAGATAYSQDELLRRRAAITVGQAIIMDWHPNAPLGSYMVGDEFLITGFVPWGGYIEFWHRIVSFMWEPAKNIVTLTTRRAEQFAYGRPVPDPQPVPAIPSGDGESDVES
ncbi:MAG TPA: hypothetical protein VK735_18405 [Pseudonocardia sp.]|uniref:hypothetical protein n=1 Tax=Pseudonocardia sp. TaxID=60912 RepID=UPI002CE230DC|nr:hypothetical protein [Pseudonocardia sp.]HTF49418.1 hypothetical protein [Pseudonocardia sp.]